VYCATLKLISCDSPNYSLSSLHPMVAFSTEVSLYMHSLSLPDTGTTLSQLLDSDIEGNEVQVPVPVMSVTFRGGVSWQYNHNYQNSCTVYCCCCCDHTSLCEGSIGVVVSFAITGILGVTKQSQILSQLPVAVLSNHSIMNNKFLCHLRLLLSNSTCKGRKCSPIPKY